MEQDEDVRDVDGKTQTVEDPPVLHYQINMWFQIKTLLTSILLLIALCFGANAKQARHETWIDIGATVVEVGPGVVAAIRGGEVLGKVSFFKPLAKTQTPSVNYASPGGVAGNNASVAGKGVTNRIPIETSNGALVRSADSPNYSVATEVQLPTSAYPGVSRQRHNQISNQAMHEAFEADPAYAAQMENLYPGIVDGVRPGPRGAFPRSAPTSDVTWHHGTQPGQMQLVPIDQHTTSGPVQGSLHPNGSGGFADWGTE